MENGLFHHSIFLIKLLDDSFKTINDIDVPSENRRITMLDIYRNGLSLLIFSFAISIITLFLEIIYLFTKFKLQDH